MADLLGFYAAIHKSNIDFVEVYVQKYTEQYIIACECSPTSHLATEGWHMHFLVKLPENRYRNLINTLKSKFGLQGKTIKNAAHGYGRVRGELRDTDRYVSYMLKDQTIGCVAQLRHKGYSLPYLLEMQSKSYPKQGKLDTRTEIMSFIDETFDPSLEFQDGILVTQPDSLSQVRQLILGYYRANKEKAPTRSYVNSLLIHYYLMHTTTMEISRIDMLFYD